MSVWDSVSLEEDKKKKSNVWNTLDIGDTPTQQPSQEARKENQFNFTETPKPATMGKNPMDMIKNPVNDFKSSLPEPQEETVRQFDGQMVPKSKARNSYGGLIYGGDIGNTQEDTTPVKKPDGISDMGRFSLDSIKYRVEQGKNLRDNITYNGMLSSRPMTPIINETITRDNRRLNEVSNAREEGNASRKEMSEWEKSFVEQNPVVGELYKAGKQFVLRDTPRNINNTIEILAMSIDSETMQDIADWAGKNSDFYLKSKVQNYQENAPQDLPSFTEGGYKDGRFYARGIGQVVPQFLTALGIAVLTKKPSVGLGLGYAQETGQAYSDLVDRGISPSDARIGANTYGVVATLLEGVNFTKYADKLIGKSVQNEVKQSWKQAIKETLAEGGIDMIKEGVTEGAQQFSQNVMTRFYDKNQDLFEGVIDSAVIGTLGGAGYAGIGLGQTLSQNSEGISESAKNTYYSLRDNISKARDIVRGKIAPKTQEEAIIAEQVVAQYENKVKETAIVIYDPKFGENNFTQEVPVNTQNSPVVKIETVKYDDGTFSASAEVNVEGNSTVVQFSDTYKSKNKAIKGVIKQVENQVPESVKKELNRPIEELLDIRRNSTPFDEPNFSESELKALAENDKKVLEQENEMKKGDILREYEASYKGEMTYPEFTKMKLKSISEDYAVKMAEIQAQIENSQAGYRNFSRNDDSPGVTVEGVPSTFPKWIPEKLRDKKLMEKTFDSVLKEDIIPERNTRMRELADVYYRYLDPNFFIYEGESAKLLNEGGRVSKNAGSTPEVARDKNNGGDQQTRDGSVPKNDDANSQKKNDGRGAKNEGTGTAKSSINNALNDVEKDFKKSESTNANQESEAYKTGSSQESDESEKYSDLGSKNREKYKSNKSNNTAESKSELISRIEQLNKFAMSRGIFRKIGGTGSEDAIGAFRKNGVKGTRGAEENLSTVGDIALRKDLFIDQKLYMSVLAHELGHALEYQITGDTNTKTIRVFGEDISEDIEAKIWEELKKNTDIMEGDIVKTDPEYYYRPTELLARFLQRFFETPIELAEVAPIATEMLLKNSLNNPILSEFLEAVNGTIDSLQRKLPNFLMLKDMKHRFQEVLGERAGNRAYITITRRNALMARSRDIFGKELKKKFEGVKNVETLYNTIEATLKTKNGEPVFGTRDFLEVKSGQRSDYADHGWVTADNQEGVAEGTVRMWTWRYTKEQGQELWSQLNDKEKQIVKDFTVEKEEAIDFFNRNVIKERYKIENTVEGWIHRFWTQEGLVGSKKLGDKEASSRRSRTLQKGEWVKDAQKALYKALVDLDNEESFNQWLRDFIPTVSKPLVEGQPADKGWIEVEGDFITGFLLQGQRNDYIVNENGTFKVKKGRYQIPEFVYKQFGTIAKISEDVGKMYQWADIIGKYWQVNMLAHPGTAVTNAISGGLQYSLKITTDIYRSLLTGDASLIKNDLSALITAVTRWNDTPDWLWGGEESTFYRDIGYIRYDGTAGKVDDILNKGANIILKPMQMFEKYWKKVLAQSSGAFAMTHLNKLTKEGLPRMDISDKEALSMIQDTVDLYGFDYENTPIWLQKVSKNPLGKLTLPFKRYLHKYLSMIMDHAITPLYDQNLSPQERFAKVLGITTWIGMLMLLYGLHDEERETPDNNTPNVPRWMNIRGKMFAGKEGDNEIFIRMAKYPGFNLVGFGYALEYATQGEFGKAGQQLGDAIDASTDGWESIGPLAQIVAHQLGWTNEYEKFKTKGQLHASTLASYTPGYRVLNDISQILDPFKRKTTNPLQEFTKLIPSRSPEMQSKLRGDPYVDKVPTGENSTESVERKNYAQDTMLSLMTGIYRSRINPDIVNAYLDRDEKNNAEKKAKEERNARDEELLKKYTDRYDAGENVVTLERELRKELNPKTPSEKSRATRLIKDWTMKREYSDDEMVQKLYKSDSTIDKIDILIKMQSDMEPEDFRKKVKKLRKEGLISDQLWGEMKKQNQ